MQQGARHHTPIAAATSAAAVLLLLLLQAHFFLAVQQAKEVLARRAGKTPATNHNPVDFTRPETWHKQQPQQQGLGHRSDDEGDEGSALLLLLYPDQAVPGDVCSVPAVEALQVLQQLATAPEDLQVLQGWIGAEWTKNTRVEWG